MKESFSLVEKIFTSEQRATEVVEKAIERIPAYGWKGRALSEGGAINSFLHNLIGNRLPSLIRRLKQYKDEKGKGFFAGKEKALDSVLTDLMLAYTWNLGQQYDNPEAFRGKKPLEWQQNYWKLAQAMACSYPNNANPCVQILECANSDHEGGKIFEKCLKVGENGGGLLSSLSNR